MSDREFMEHRSGVRYANTLAYEIKTQVGEQTTRLGWVVELEDRGKRSWVALAVLSHTGDSFLGRYATASQAIQALVVNEQNLVEEDE